MWADMAMDGITEPNTAIDRINKAHSEFFDFVRYAYGYEMISEKEYNFLMDEIYFAYNNGKEEALRKLYDNWEIAEENFRAREEIENRKNRAV